MVSVQTVISGQTMVKYGQPEEGGDPAHVWPMRQKRFERAADEMRQWSNGGVHKAVVKPRSDSGGQTAVKLRRWRPGSGNANMVKVVKVVKKLVTAHR